MLHLLILSLELCVEWSLAVSVFSAGKVKAVERNSSFQRSSVIVMDTVLFKLFNSVCSFSSSVHLSISHPFIHPESFCFGSQKAHRLYYVLLNRSSWICPHSNMWFVSPRMTEPANSSSILIGRQSPLQSALSFRSALSVLLLTILALQLKS